MSFTSQDKEFMKQALREGARGLGFVSPNPAVGCVIVNKDGQEIGRGFHAKAGEAHAEVAALNSVKDHSQLAGATVFVTLEPCASQGRTPSCAHTLEKLPIKKVIFGCKDPNPKMAHGQKVLQDAGIECLFMEEMELECSELAEVFLCNQIEKRPFVHVKVGTSLDGQIALQNGESQWITSEESRAQVQILRGYCDAVLVGRRTYETDNPRLNSRATAFVNKENSVVIIDPKGKTLESLKDSALHGVRSAEKIFIITSETTKPPQSTPYQIIPCSEKNGSLDLKQAFHILLEKGVTSLFVEGGATTLTHHFQQNLVDRLTVFLAPKILGSGGGVSWTQGLKIGELKNAICLYPPVVTQYGSDICLSSRIKTNA